MGVSIYKIKKWYKMLVGKSISHVNQGIGKNYSKTSVGGYYNDFTEKVTKDAPEILVPMYYVDTGDRIFFSIGIFQYGLGSYDLYLQTKDDLYKKKFLACADWAVQNQQDSGSWITFAYENPEHPYSSMAQGEATSLLIRCYIETKEQKYFEAAKKAIDFMLICIESGGTTKYEGEDIYLYEFTQKPIVLNGWIFSYWGLREFSFFADEEKYLLLSKKVLTTMIKTLPKYDLGFWSRYDLTERIASPFYHKLHIAQLQSMYDLTGDETFKFYADKFRKYQDNWFNRKRAFLEKAIQKIFE